jgi:urease accessory protein
MVIATETSGASGAALLKLLSWLSPSFPVGAYSYSHGIEYAIECGLINDSKTLHDWLETILYAGAAQTDAVLLARSYEAVLDEDEPRVTELIELADALRGSKEMALESSAQGGAFWQMLVKTWPADSFSQFQQLLDESRRKPAYPLAVAVAAAAHRLPLEAVVQGYLHATCSNLISAGVRLIPLGQSAGQQVIAELEDIVLDASTRALGTPLDEIGSATPMVDWTSICHETQYTRIFRS